MESEAEWPLTEGDKKFINEVGERLRVKLAQQTAEIMAAKYGTNVGEGTTDGTEATDTPNGEEPSSDAPAT